MSARRSRSSTPRTGLVVRGLLPGLLATWIVAFVAMGALVGSRAGSVLPRQAIVLAAASVITAIVSWVGWTILVSPGRRLRFRASVLAFGEDRASRSFTTHDEFHDLDRALSRLSDRITKQEATITRERRTLRTLIDSQTEPMVAIDAGGLVTLSNAAADAFLRVGAGVLRGKLLRSYLTSAQLLHALDAALAGRTYRGRVTIPTESGERTWDCSAAPLPIPESDQPGALLVLRDVTELADAVRVKTDFVANASHELRTPLAAIRGAVETLQSDTGANPKIASRMHEIIAGHVLRLEDLVQDLLDLSRVESGEAMLRIEPLRLDLLKQAIRDQFEAICAARGIHIVFDIVDSLEGWRTDPRLIVLILRNLVENASKFAHDNTDVRIIGRIEHADQDIVRFEVRDKGIGIPLSQQQRVFERFYQVDPARPGYEQLSSIGRARRGTGLGLAIVRHAVKALGGRVGIQSVYTQGATVWFEMPYHVPSDLPQQPLDESFEEDARFIDEPDSPGAPDGTRTSPENR